MPKLSDAEIAEATGRPAPKKEGPTNRLEACLGDLDELDGRMAALAEKHRQPGETHEQARARLMTENPRLYTEHKAAKAGLLSKNRFEDAATGGL
jgi:hypothetical protein